MTHTETYDRVPIHRNNDRCKWVGTLKITLGTWISLEATAGDDDLVRLRAEAGIQVGKDSFHRGGIVESSLDTPWAIRS